MSMKKTTDIELEELFASMSLSSVAKSQEVKAHPLSANVSIFLPAASFTALKERNDQYVMDMEWDRGIKTARSAVFKNPRAALFFFCGAAKFCWWIH